MSAKTIYEMSDPIRAAYKFLATGEFDNDNPGTEEFSLSPYEQPYRLENWDFDDLVMYCGGVYAKEAYSNGAV